jgi:Dehydratase medium subunit
VTGPGERPAVLVYRQRGAPPAVLREVCAGVEEEGVPAEVVDAPDGLTATALAYAAAQASRLEVGIGVDAAGATAVHHGKLPLERPPAAAGADARPPDRRRIGRIGARVVKNLPLG